MIVNKSYLGDTILIFHSNILSWEFQKKNNFSNILSLWTSEPVTLGLYIHLSV